MTWILSLTSCATLWLMGNKTIWGPIVGIISQFLWFYYIYTTKQWGLALGSVVYLIVNVRNFIKWRNNA